MNLNTKQKLILLTLSTLLMLTVPVAALLMNYDWQPNEALSSYHWLYWLTESGSLPFALLTCAAFTGIALLYLKLDAKKSALFVLSLFLCIGAGQVIKAGIKEMQKESRPYIVWLDQQGYIQQDTFYNLNRNERKEFILAQDFSAHNIPAWLQKHWSKETGYTFPSGHSLFAAQWLLLFVLLLWGRKTFLITLPLIAFWSLSMEASRLLLGMHWPIDEIVSCLFTPIIIFLTSLGWDRWIFASLPKPIKQ